MIPKRHASISALGLGLVLLASPSLQAAGAAHEVLHVGNPLVQTFKALYPARVQVELLDSGEVHTVLNEGERFEVLEGAHGEPYLLIEAEAGALERITGLLAQGWPEDPAARLTIAGELACRTSKNFGNPHLDDPEPSGTGPSFGRATEHFLNLRTSLSRVLDFLNRASFATRKVEKLYFGARAKLELTALESWKRTFLSHLLRELEDDLACGRTGLRPGGYWSSWVDAHGFLFVIADSRGESGAVITALIDRLQGRLAAARAEGEADDPVIVSRLGLLEQMAGLSGYDCSR